MIGISVAANKEWYCVREYFKDSINDLGDYPRCAYSFSSVCIVASQEAESF